MYLFELSFSLKKFKIQRNKLLLKPKGHVPLAHKKLKQTNLTQNG